MGDDFWRDPAALVWAKDVVENLKPKLEDSDVFVSLVPDDRYGDAKFWVELGGAIMLDKPIIAVLFNDAPIPPKLAQIADEIVLVPRGVDLAASEDLAAAIERTALKEDE